VLSHPGSTRIATSIELWDWLSCRGPLGWLCQAAISLCMNRYSYQSPHHLQHPLRLHHVKISFWCRLQTSTKPHVRPAFSGQLIRILCYNIYNPILYFLYYIESTSCCDIRHSFATIDLVIIDPSSFVRFVLYVCLRLSLRCILFT
jgi:hypothetical protein